MPLTSGYALEEEGHAMHHCVGSYLGHCLTGRSRIFSIRKNDKRVATLELTPDLDGERRLVMASQDPEKDDTYIFLEWKAFQCYGVCNQLVDKKVKKVADYVARRYSKAADEAYKALKLEQSQNQLVGAV